MVEKVFENIHRVELPLPNNPLKAVNCYVIRSDDRSLVIDTGMNRPECRSAMESGLKELDVDLNRTDFFITHLHSDHMGQVSHFAGEGSTVYFNPIEAKMVAFAKQQGGFGSRMTHFAQIAGFSEEEIHKSLANHPGLKFQAPHSIEFTILDDGDSLDFGEFHFKCIHTPGHSPGHLCLYDAEKKLMIAGDHVLGNITPNISAMTIEEDPLGEFLDSLDKVYDYEVELALTGHRSMIHDFRGRVDELKQHHQDRLDEVMSILNGQALSGYDTASQMSWRLKGKTWPDAGIMQKWFATGEAIAHLNYLERAGKVRSETQNNVVVFQSV